MATVTARLNRVTASMWAAGAFAGLLAAAGMGLVLHAGADMMPLIGALYGRESVLFGWLAHLFNGVVFALVFVALVSRRVFREYTRSVTEHVLFGLGYGAALGVVAGGVLLPLWLGAVGATALPEPLVPVPGEPAYAMGLFFALAHLVYGVLLGGVYGALHGVTAGASGAEPDVPAGQ